MSALGNKKIGDIVKIDFDYRHSWQSYGNNHNFIVLKNDSQSGNVWLLSQQSLITRQDSLNYTYHGAYYSSVSECLSVFRDNIPIGIKNNLIDIGAGKVFLLSKDEIDGDSCLDYFTNHSISDLGITDVKDLYNVVSGWWTRTEYSSGRYYYVTTDSNNCELKVSEQNGYHLVQPAVVLPYFMNVTDDGQIDGEIAKGQIIKLDKPYFKDTNNDILNLDYNGLLQTPELFGFDSTTMEISGTVNGTIAKGYEIIISLKNEENWFYQWNDGSVKDVVLKWNINPIKIKKPEVWIETTSEDGEKIKTQYKEGEDFSFDYSGYAPSYPECWKIPVTADGTSIQDECYADNKKYTDVLTMTGDEDGLSRQYAYKDGGYSITFSIKDAESCSWETDGDEPDTDDYVVTWYINKIKVPIPVKEAEEDFTYDSNYYGIKESGFSGDRAFTVLNYNTKIMTMGGSTFAANSGDYTITYNLYNTDSCSWEGNSVTPKSIAWKIKKQRVYFDAPYLADDQKSFKYDGTLHEPVITYDENKKGFNYKEVSGTLSSKAANKNDTPYYEIRVKLRENTNYEFLWNINDIVTDPKQDVFLQWRVLKSSFKVPKVSLEHRPFTGQTQYETPSEENGYFNKVMKYTGKTSGKKADTYEIVYELLDRDSSSWEDENGNIIDNEPKSVSWHIDRILVLVPKVTETELPVSWYVYSGNVYCNYQSPLIDGYNEYLMSRSEYSECYPNEYKLKFCLLDPESSAWGDEDNTTDCKEFPWRITKEIKQYEKPRFNPEYPVFDYNGKEQIAAWENYNFSIYSGNYRFERFYNQNVMRYIQNSDRGTKAKDYSVTVELCENNIFDFQWTDGTKAPVTLPWKINFKKFPKPELESEAFTFTNTRIEVKEIGFVEYAMVRTSGSQTHGISAGEYTITYQLTDITSSSWEDGSTGEHTIKWNIIALTGEENAVKIPTVTDENFPTDVETDIEFTYDGNSHAPLISPYDENIIGYRGYKSAVNANEYYITFYLKDPNSSCWIGGTVEDKKYTWVIKKLVEYIERPKIENGYKEFEYDGRYKITRITGLSAVK